MIDIKKAKNAFKEYVKNYDIKNKKIQLKIAHIERTAEISRKIAEGLKLEEEKVKCYLKENGFYPAYHMNKKNWITVLLDGTVADEKMISLIEESYLNTGRTRQTG